MTPPTVPALPGMSPLGLHVVEADRFTDRVAVLVDSGMHKDAALKIAWAEALDARHHWTSPCPDRTCIELRTTRVVAGAIDR